MVKLFLKNSNLCDHNSPTSQTDGQTTCDRNTAVCTKVHRAVKITHHDRNSPQNYGTSPVIWDHICHLTQVNTPHLTPARKAGTRFTFPGRIEGWVDLGGWLHTKTVYPPADGHPPNINLARHTVTSWYRPMRYHLRLSQAINRDL